MNYKKTKFRILVKFDKFVYKFKKFLLLVLIVEISLYTGYWFAMKKMNRPIRYELAHTTEASTEASTKPIKASGAVLNGEVLVVPLIKKIAAEYGVSSHLMTELVRCESSFVSDVQSNYRYSDGGREESFGLSQIHLRAHTTVSIEQANNPDFALRFMAKQISQGNAKIWSCYKIIKNKGII